MSCFKDDIFNNSKDLFFYIDMKIVMQVSEDVTMIFTQGFTKNCNMRDALQNDLKNHFEMIFQRWSTMSLLSGVNDTGITQTSVNGFLIT